MAHYIDTRGFYETNESGGGFRLAIDILIDIVDKIEAYAPSI